MKTATRLLVLTLFAAGLSACADTPLLRDHYMGQKWLEPELLPQKVPRDEFGNAQAETQLRDLEGFWQKLKFWQTDP